MSLPKLECDRPQQVVNGNGTVAEGVNSLATYGERRLRLNPNMEHKPEKYDDVESDYGPIIFSMLERHLPPSMLDVSRDAKISFMKDILSRYLPEGERSRTQRNKEYRKKIISAYEFDTVYSNFLTMWTLRNEMTFEVS
ncbi:hypothetical protein ZOSMA_92G00560 [Zostera marina]|uniref:PKHD-type hydroxylase n=1 Tax=Zostera marina TaxID=29655 RepID=A0A0K9NL61_ZOSMR|nr:hypothetical protein ZOSMA_92G00560 [Zostera marina]